MIVHILLLLLASPLSDDEPSNCHVHGVTWGSTSYYAIFEDNKQRFALDVFEDELFNVPWRYVNRMPLSAVDLPRGYLWGGKNGNVFGVFLYDNDKTQDLLISEGDVVRVFQGELGIYAVINDWNNANEPAALYKYSAEKNKLAKLYGFPSPAVKVINKQWLEDRTRKVDSVFYISGTDGWGYKFDEFHKSYFLQCSV